MQRMTDRALNSNQLHFIDELLAQVRLNATAAYLVAYGTNNAKSAGVNAHKLMQDPRVIATIAERKAERRARVAMKQDDVVQHLQELVEADPRELTEWHVGACRHCHGYQFAYLRTPEELRRDLAAHIERCDMRGKPDPLGLTFDAMGGIGYNPHHEPHPDCPECFGRGVGFEVIRDTRTLSPAAARLYAGVKRTKNGIEVVTRSQDKALEMMGRHHGAFKDTLGLTGAGGGPIAIDMQLNGDPVQAAAAYAKMIGG